MQKDSAMTPETTGTRTTLESLGQRLLVILREQDALHDLMLDLLRRKRETIRIANFNALAGLSAEERRTATAITEREEIRLTLLEKAQPWFDPDTVPTVTAIADRLDGELAEHLRVYAGILRHKLETLRTESAILRDAATSLSDHLAGLVQTVQSAISRAKVYGRTGQLAMNASIDASLDLKT
ncbi:MAG: flagellar export chaperone FlgN [Phycisphaerales bacterium]|nr:flagellar export chaperone FlgN [Phycisphaerales bacterium]